MSFSSPDLIQKIRPPIYLGIMGFFRDEARRAAFFIQFLGFLGLGTYVVFVRKNSKRSGRASLKGSLHKSILACSAIADKPILSILFIVFVEIRSFTKRFPSGQNIFFDWLFMSCHFRHFLLENVMVFALFLLRIASISFLRLAVIAHLDLNSDWLMNDLLCLLENSVEEFKKFNIENPM